ncbi:MAG: hypothetical protein IAG13_18840 [Deltaproteobacteria bacterium]|nr:hypothetical protein [Nannocystaceae bacterium]
MSSAVPEESFLPALLRAFWMLFGNGVVLVVALMIARLPPWSLGWRDLLLAASVGCLVWSRWLDAHRYGGTAADGAPMTHAMLLRWTATVVASTLALWVVVQSIGF